ncbi:helix-turn-helix domain-containing protein [Haematobacter missouriensis]|uniref:HTH araC/xylS-type domain-containing protein n=1 Tax=Haematobacter missouriensis TaxID=366616 RepID=A0A212AQC1_9RHOB|nr:helix-turn-helix domain-containing protein [Haematobacter missouriensis]OWJ70658.1 hypothetical protein CDV53_20420 [Haematobacter missouriensis]OWJ83659.1 hypothetical protein CDV52_10265 [Haematobacter missouriensis]
MTPTYRHTLCHAIEELECGMPGWEQRYHPVAPGGVLGEISRLDFGTLSIYCEEMQRLTLNSFSMPEGRLAVYFLLGGTEGGGSSLLEAGFAMTARWLTMLQRPGVRCISVELPVDLLPAAKEVGAQLGYSGVFHHQSKGGIAQTGQWLDFLISPTDGAYSRGNASLLAIAPGLITDRLTLWFEERVWARKRREGTARAFAATLDWLAAAEAVDMTVTQLSAATGFDSRTLRRASMAEAGLGLDRLLTMQRLNLARRALLTARETGGRERAAKVSDIALDHGFLHWGRFAGQYRAMFGERPTDTLRGRLALAGE